MKIETGCQVQLAYTLSGSDGETIETSETQGPMEYEHGAGQVPEAIETALAGQEPGYQVKVTLGPGEAYGPYDPEQIIAVPRDQFPPDAELVKGDWIEMELEAEEGDELPDGELETMEARVVEFNAEAVTLDLNHPLADQEVTFAIEIVNVSR